VFGRSHFAGGRNMIVDDCLFAIIIAGIGLAVSYLRAESALRRGIEVAARRDDLRLRELHAMNTWTRILLILGIAGILFVQTACALSNSDPRTGSIGNGRSGIAIAHSDPTFRITEWITIDSAIATGNVEYGIWSDTSNTTPTEPVNHLTIENTCLSDNMLVPTLFANLGPDVTMKNDKVSGCGPK
jgi:hypothetical protein